MIYASISQVENLDIDFTRYIRVKVEGRFRIEKDIEILRLENKSIDKIKAFFIDDIVFENNMQ